MVAVGRVRVEDKVGNDFADRAADFGRRRFGHGRSLAFSLCLFSLVSCCFRASSLFCCCCSCCG